MSKKYDQYEQFLRDVDLHGPTLLVREQDIKPVAREMAQKVITGTQAMFDHVRAEIAKRPEIASEQPKPAKIAFSELKKMSPSAKLDVSNNVPAPTLNGLKKPNE